MRAIKYRELRRMYDVNGPEKTVRHLQEALQKRELKPEDFSIRELAEATLGTERVRQMDARSGGTCLLEAGDGVDATAFSNITGQVVQAKILDAYTQEAFVLSGLVETISTRFDGERIPGIGRIKDETSEVQPGMPYPSLGFGEDYIETPATTKRGFIVPVTKEAIFFDRTHLILQRAAEVGEVLGLNKEKRLIDVLIGATNNYNWKGTSYNTYYASGAHPLAADAGGWTNAITDALTDWTDIDAAEQRFTNILDPSTGEPVLISATTLLTTPALKATARRILTASEVRTTTGGSIETVSGNPLNGYRALDSRLLYRRLVASGVAGDTTAAAKYWFLGDFAKAIAYMENWPITVVQAPANSEAEFTQDIVARFKVSERGAAVVMNPRYIVRSTGAGA